MLYCHHGDNHMETTMEPYVDEEARDALISPKSEDPELQLDRMRNTAREASEDLIPVLVEKAVNAKTKDSLAIFEALADRSGFHRPPQATSQGNVPLITLNIQAQDMTNMLTGLKTITNQDKQKELKDVTPSQNGQDVQNG